VSTAMLFDAPIIYGDLRTMCALSPRYCVVVGVVDEARVNMILENRLHGRGAAGVDEVESFNSDGSMIKDPFSYVYVLVFDGCADGDVGILAWVGGWGGELDGRWALVGRGTGFGSGENTVDDAFVWVFLRVGGVY